VDIVRGGKSGAAAIAVAVPTMMKRPAHLTPEEDKQE
jgi:hypothetical protein